MQIARIGLGQVMKSMSSSGIVVVSLSLDRW